MEQNSEDWLKWRTKGVGASDAPIIMNASPFKTRLALWEEKTGLAEPEGENYATHKGHALEEIARRHYELDFEIKCEPKSLEHPEYSFIRASLDGWNEENKLVLEIKCPGKETHEKAKAGEVPRHYWIQMQQQMFVANAELAHYYSFNGEEGAMVVVNRDSRFINDELLPAVCEFWNLVETKTPPELSENDYVNSSNKKIVQLVGEYSSLKAQLDGLKKQLEEKKNEIIDIVPHKRVKVGKAKIIQGFRKGSVDYAKIPELKDVDLEGYRKPPIAYTMIKL